MIITEVLAIANVETTAIKAAERMAKRLTKLGYQVLEFGAKPIQVEKIKTEVYNGEYIETLAEPKIVYHTEFQAVIKYIDEDAEEE